MASLLVIVVNLVCCDRANVFVDAVLRQSVPIPLVAGCKMVLLLLPLLVLAWYDFHNTSKTFFHDRYFFFPAGSISYLLRVAGGYGDR